MAERSVVPRKPGNAGAGKGPQLKTNARSDEDGADEFMNQLQQAQELGAHAMKAQKIAKIVSGLIAGGTATRLLTVKGE